METYIEKIKDDFEQKLFIEKKLCSNGKLNERYFILYKNYRILLEQYLLKKLPLKQMDESLNNYSLLFMPVEYNNMDFYQKISGMKLKYIYLRNDIYVEKLSVEEIEFVINLPVDSLKNPGNKIFNFIEKTYVNILNANIHNNDEVYFCCYGIDIDNYWKDSRELVFGVRFDSFADNGLDDDEEWSNNYFKQNLYLDTLIKEFEKKVANIIDVKINFLIFDDFTLEKTMLK